MAELPVDLWVMNVEDETDVQRVDTVVRALFGEAFAWNYGTPDHEPKGCVRKIDRQTAHLACKSLDAVGARTLIDEGAYRDPDLWVSTITPEENRHDAFGLIERYLSDPRGAKGGVLQVAIDVDAAGMIHRLASTWLPASEPSSLPASRFARSHPDT